MAMDDGQIPELLARLRAGDPAARTEMFEYVAIRFQPLAHKLLRVDFPRVGLHAETSDILHDTLCRLIPYLERTGPETCPGAEQFYGLAATVIRHTLLDAARKFFGKVRGHPLVADLEATHPELQEPSGLQLWRERFRVHELIERLTPDQRQVLEMKLYLGFGTAEIASRLGVHAGTVSRRLAAAKEALGRHLHDDDARAG